jgi:hypothetical protein
LVACCWSRESSEFILNTETKTYKNIISQNRLSSCVQGAEVGGGDVHSVHGVHPSRGQTHSCRFKEVAACMQHADMLSFIVLKLTAPVMQGAAAGCIKCVYLLTNSRRKKPL